MIVAGTLPLRKPGTLICWAIFLYAESRLGFSSSKGTSTVSLARVGLRVSTALFTCVLLGVAARCSRARARTGQGFWVGARSGRQDSNLRSPAPKAGALATTLRPGGTRASLVFGPSPVETRERRTGRREGPHGCGTMSPAATRKGAQRRADVAQW